VSHGECVRDRAAVDIQPRRAESRGLDLPFVTWNGLNVACATNRPDLILEPREAKMPILRVVVDRTRSADRGWHRLRRREPLWMSHISEAAVAGSCLVAPAKRCAARYTGARSFSWDA